MSELTCHYPDLEYDDDDYEVDPDEFEVTNVSFIGWSNPDQFDIVVEVKNCVYSGVAITLDGEDLKHLFEELKEMFDG